LGGRNHGGLASEANPRVAFGCWTM